MNGAGNPRSWLDRLVGVALSVFLIAVLLRLAVSLLTPIVGWLIVVGGGAVALFGWRAWQRSRW